MSVILGIFGALVGIVVGAAFGYGGTLTSVNKSHTIADETNPELPPLPPPSKGNLIFMLVLGVIFAGCAMFSMYFGITHFGMSASELNANAGSGTSYGVGGSAFVVVGLFIGFIAYACIANFIQEINK